MGIYRQDRTTLFCTTSQCLSSLRGQQNRREISTPKDKSGSGYGDLLSLFEGWMSFYINNVA